MNIDFQKLAQLLIPTFLRKTYLIELFAPLVGQLQIMHSQFNLWFEDARYNANTNASVLSLTHIIQREFDVLANIEELDGMPTDFMVTVSGTVDEVRLRTLINQYKIAGRSFTFRVGNVAYSTSFSNHVCEDIIELYSVGFIDHVCEDNGIVNLTYEIETTQIVFGASRPVKSELTISGRIRASGPNGLHYVAADFTVIILEGETSGFAAIDLNPVSGETYYLDQYGFTINPGSDTYFNYTLE